MGSIPVAGAILSIVLCVNVVPIGWKDGVPCIHTQAIVKRGSFPSAIPKNALYQKCFFFYIARWGFPLCETLGECEKMA